MSDCKRYEELCSLSLDSALSRAEKRELGAHLNECAACKACLEDMQLLRAAWGDFKEPLPDALHEKIMQGILAEAAKKVVPAPKQKRLMPVFTMIAAAAACVMLVVSGAIANVFGGLGHDGGAAPAAGSRAAEGAAGGDNTPALAFEDGGDSGLQTADEQTPQAFSAPQEQTGSSSAAAQDRMQEKDASVPQPADGAQQQEAALPSFSVGAARSVQNAAESLSVTLPGALSAHSFGFCYVAVGSGDAPAPSEASLIEKDGDTYYFRIENNMSSLEKIRTQLIDAGYETAMRTDIGITADEDAADSLLIVSLRP